MGIKMSNAFPSKFLKAADLQDQQHEVIIDHVEMGDEMDGERKPVVFFQGKAKGLVLNKTNAKQIVTAYGDDSDDWTGKPLVLFPTMVDFRGDMVEAIRVKIPKPKITPEQRKAEMSDDIPFMHEWR
jgi:hypothetical protein